MSYDDLEKLYLSQHKSELPSNKSKKLKRIDCVKIKKGVKYFDFTMLNPLTPNGLDDGGRVLGGDASQSILNVKFVKGETKEV
jgi:hypothetical protein